MDLAEMVGGMLPQDVRPALVRATVRACEKLCGHEGDCDCGDIPRDKVGEVADVITKASRIAVRHKRKR